MACEWAVVDRTRWYAGPGQPSGPATSPPPSRPGRRPLRRCARGAGQDLGRVLYDLAGTLLDRGRPDDAVAALDEAEQAYGGRFPGALADVQARRAVAYGLVGAGASAVVDAQSAVLHRRGGKRRELARALAVNADVLAAYGDPDLAVASADLAVRLFLAGRGARGADRAELHRALAVAVAVHSAHGRHDLARQAGAVARRTGDGAGVTVLGGRGVGVMTVAGALEVARQRLGREPPRIADRPVVRPAVDLVLVVPLDRVSDAGGADAAVRLGRTLAGLAIELVPLDGTAGARLGLEAHALLAGAARLGSELLADRLPTFGPPWAAALLACSRRAQAGADPELALDLAAWGAGVAEQLFPAALVDRGTRAVATDALHHHGALATALRSPPR